MSAFNLSRKSRKLKLRFDGLSCRGIASVHDGTIQTRLSLGDLLWSSRALFGSRTVMKSPAKQLSPSIRRTLDRIDLSILEALRQSGRITYQALSERVGLSARPCLERVKRLEQKGVIRGYTVLVEPSALGHDIIAMAGISMRDPSAVARQRLERALMVHPAVVELQVVNGEYDYIARIVAPSLAGYEALTDAFLADPGFGIGRIHTTFVLKTLKGFDGYPIANSRD
jgi:DNA-binding Lrp family transcriptional regulator